MRKIALNLFITLFVFSLVLSKERLDVGYTTPLKSFNNQVVNNNKIKSYSHQNDIDRDIVVVYSNDFEGDDMWNGDAGWTLTEDDYNSETHSWNSPNDETTLNNQWNLLSNPISLPQIGDGDIMHFSFFINSSGMVDVDGDGDDYLDDYYSVSVMDPSALAWHITDFNSVDDNGDNWFCGLEDVGNGGPGYLDAWVQYLDTPSFVVPDGGTLNADLFWGLESPDGAEVAGTCTDGWDQANVQISVDGGLSFNMLESDAFPYDFGCGYGMVYNGFECNLGDCPGWGGYSPGLDGWNNVGFDLSAYAGQEAIVRFAFYSDPAYSTMDEETATGFQVDNVAVSGTVIDTADDTDNMSVSGSVWVDQFYDYGDPAQPGGEGWTEYLPEYPFNGNVFLDISNFSGSDVIFKFQSRYDDNHDGGQGAGLFIDDFSIWIEAPAGPPPSGLAGVALDSEVELSWDDMNASGTFDFSFDNNTFTNEISLTEGTGYAGERFEIVGQSTVNTVQVYNFNSSVVSTELAGFSSVGSFVSPSPTYTMDVTLDPGWNTIQVDGWTFNNYLILGMEISPEVGIALDESATPSSNSVILFGSWGSWSEVAVSNGLPDGEFGINANISTTGANVTYNVFREGASVATGLTDSFYTDSGLENNTTYEYHLTATYPSGDSSDPSESIELTPQSNTVYEQAYDDGTWEDQYDPGSGHFALVKFNAPGDQPVVRARWYQTSAGGALYLKFFDDNNGVPGEEMHSTVVAQGLVEGWCERDLLDAGYVMNGDFWMGIKAFTSTQNIGIDMDNSGSSVYREGSAGDWMEFSGNLMIRVLLDEGDGGGGCDIGDLNGDGSIDVLDIVTIVNFILDEDSPIDECAGDTNEDGSIDVLDIVTIVNLILGG